MDQAADWGLYQDRVRVRVRVTELVYQIGFTTLFRSQRQENILAASSKQQAAASSKQQAASSKQQAASSKQQQQAASSKQQAATELISAYLHICVNIDGTSPKLSWYIVLMMPYNHTKFQVRTHQGAGSVGKKVQKIPRIRKV